MLRILFPIFILMVMFFSCNQPGEAEVDVEQVSKAYRQVAIQNCSSCHKFPEPDLLDKETWRSYVLPRMGYFCGIYLDESERSDLIEEGLGGQAVLAANIFPEERLVDSTTWKKIVQYYLHNAPDKLPEQNRQDLEKLELFEIKEPGLVLSPPSSTLVNFTETGEVVIGDAHTGAIYFMNKGLELESAARVREGAVHLRSTDNDWWVTVMGSFSPTDAKSGMIVKLPRDQSGSPEIVINGLQRPVHALYEDFNQDGHTDIVISEFGKWTGSLSLYFNQGDDTFRRSVIEGRCGATKAVARDINNDGLPDFVALFGQGLEALEAYINKGDGSFEHRRLLEFESSFGSSYFSFYDLDNDGDEDIVYTAGDNADYLPILKPYHGVYLYTNEGNLNFELSDFLPQNGAYKAIPADFDGDGDLDIASISFFPDYTDQPNEGFVYFENRDGQYTRKTMENLRLGRWISMDHADYDQDGDEDLVLGSLAFETVPVQQELESNWINRGIPFIILENQSR